MKFIHLSDLHFNPRGDGRGSRSIRNGLIPYLQQLNISVDELLITGDYRHARFQGNDQAEIDAVVKYIRDIAEALGITDIKHIHLVPGNHDRDRKKGEARKMSGIRKKYNPLNGRFDEKDFDFLIQKFEYFRLVCSSLFGSDNYWGYKTLHTYRVIGGTVFLYLNTAIMHNCDEDRKQHRLIIGNDYLDQLLDEIGKDYPDLPIIVLAHHSPDYFEKHEKEAIEDILKQHPKVFLYLCGDAHEAWLRKVNFHLEITMGCLKQEKSVEATFLYGDTDIQEYTVHHWVRAWEPYVAANKQILDLIQVPMATDNHGDLLSRFLYLIIPIDEDGNMEADANMRNRLLQWIASGKKENLRVKLDVKKIRDLTHRCQELHEKMTKGIVLERAEENEYIRYAEDIDRLNRWAILLNTACECFLHDGLMQSFCQISTLEDYLDMLARIIALEYEEDYRRRNSKDYTAVDFTVSRSTANKDYYFSVPIKSQTLKELRLNSSMSFMDICLIRIEQFNIDSRKYIYSYFYRDFAREILYQDNTIQKDARAKNLLNYYLGIH